MEKRKVRVDGHRFIIQSMHFVAASGQQGTLVTLKIEGRKGIYIGTALEHPGEKASNLGVRYALERAVTHSFLDVTGVATAKKVHRLAKEINAELRRQRYLETKEENAVRSG